MKKNSIAFFVFFVLALLLLSCGNKSRETGLPSEPIVDQAILDSIATSVREDARSENLPQVPSPREEVKSSPRVSSSSSSYYDRDDDEPDNMRGFDPASEDDMEDNGMSRYMENYDEEGWD